MRELPGLTALLASPSTTSNRLSPFRPDPCSNARWQVLLGLERFSEAHHALDEALRLGYSDVDVHNWQGLVYRAEHKWDKAVESITQSIQADPFAAKYYFNRGQCHQFAGAMGNALEDFSRALAHDPGEALCDPPPYAAVHLRCPLALPRLAPVNGFSSQVTRAHAS